MDDIIFKVVYIAGFFIEIAIRVPYRRRNRGNIITNRGESRLDLALLSLLLIGMFLAPALYIFTPWLDFANYTLPDWAGIGGIVIFAASVWLFWRSHIDLGRNWSPLLEVRKGHNLVTAGVYRYIRHPMYASQWLWCIGQALLLHNWLAGPLNALLFLPFYLVRVAREERMMLENFGEEYQEYMKKTGRVVPPLRG